MTQPKPTKMLARYTYIPPPNQPTAQKLRPPPPTSTITPAVHIPTRVQSQNYFVHLFNDEEELDLQESTRDQSANQSNPQIPHRRITTWTYAFGLPANGLLSLGLFGPKTAHNSRGYV